MYGFSGLRSRIYGLAFWGSGFGVCGLRASELGICWRHKDTRLVVSPSELCRGYDAPIIHEMLDGWRAFGHTGDVGGEDLYRLSGSCRVLGSA